jgi:hypothetical protein
MKAKFAERRSRSRPPAFGKFIAEETGIRAANIKVE